MRGLRVLVNPQLQAAPAYPLQLRGNLVALGNWEPLQVLEQKSFRMGFVFLEPVWTACHHPNQL